MNLKINRVVTDYVKGNNEITYILNGHVVWIGTLINRVHLEIGTTHYSYSSRALLRLAKAIGQNRPGVNVSMLDVELDDFLKRSGCL